MNRAVVVVMVTGLLPVQHSVPDPLPAVINEPVRRHQEGVLQEGDHDYSDGEGSPHGHSLAKCPATCRPSHVTKGYDLREALHAGPAICRARYLEAQSQAKDFGIAPFWADFRLSTFQLKPAPHTSGVPREVLPEKAPQGPLLRRDLKAVYADDECRQHKNGDGCARNTAHPSKAINCSARTSKRGDARHADEQSD